MTPSQMRSGAVQTLTDIDKEAAQRRAQAGMLSGGRPIRN